MNNLENIKTAAAIQSINHPRVEQIAIAAKPINISQAKPFANLYAICAERMNVIRFLSVCSIVWGHCLLGWDKVQSQNEVFLFTRTFFMQIGRIGTINFFFISGYFLKDKINQFNVLSYLRHRLFTLILPWVFFLVLFVSIQLFEIVPFSQLVSSSLTHIIGIAIRLSSAFIFHSAYWFVPASLVSATILVMFRKHLNSIWLGATLVLITLAYGVNLYYGWITTSHSKAFVGYTLFMYLGIQLKTYLPRVKAFIDNLSWFIIVPAFILSFMLAAAEGVRLTNIGSADPFASIRLTNAMLSAVFFLSLLKSARFDWVNVFNPRKTVYGIYLIHCIIISQLTGLISKYISQADQTSNLQFSIMIQILFFALIMFASWLLVVTINRSPIKFIIGTKK